jgi:hypothetical protein
MWTSVFSKLNPNPIIPTIIIPSDPDPQPIAPKLLIDSATRFFNGADQRHALSETRKQEIGQFCRNQLGIARWAAGYRLDDNAFKNALVRLLSHADFFYAFGHHAGAIALALAIKQSAYDFKGIHPTLDNTQDAANNLRRTFFDLIEAHADERKSYAAQYIRDEIIKDATWAQLKSEVDETLIDDDLKGRYELLCAIFEGGVLPEYYDDATVAAIQKYILNRALTIDDFIKITDDKGPRFWEILKRRGAQEYADLGKFEIKDMTSARVETILHYLKFSQPVIEAYEYEIERGRMLDFDVLIRIADLDIRLRKPDTEVSDLLRALNSGLVTIIQILSDEDRVEERLRGYCQL